MKQLEKSEQLEYLEGLENRLREGFFTKEEGDQFRKEINSGVIQDDSKRNPYIHQRTIISNQLWMSENLRVSYFRNGDIIQEAKSFEDWKRFFRDRIPAWCYYQFEPSIGGIFGKLYNKEAVNDPRGLAPYGWHIPTIEEWKVLISNLGGPSDAGGAMKSTKKTGNPGLVYICQSGIGVTGWSIEDIGSTNSSGFNGLPGGFLIAQSEFRSLGRDAYWWSSSKNENGSQLACHVSYIGPYIGYNAGYEVCALSVRSIRDYETKISWV